MKLNIVQYLVKTDIDNCEILIKIKIIQILSIKYMLK